MNRLTPPLCGLLCALLCVTLSSCRTKPPVVQHFLRMPADYAGGLTTTERAHWLKTSRRQLPPRRELSATGHLILPSFSSDLGTRLDGMEMLYAPGESAATAGLAVLTRRSGDSRESRAWPLFVSYDHTRYTNAPPHLLRPAESVHSWKMDSTSHTVTGYSSGGHAVLALRWSGHCWLQAEKR